MAIIANLNDKEWEKVQQILEQTLRNRKYQFQQEEMFKIVQVKCSEEEIDSAILGTIKK